MMLRWIAVPTRQRVQEPATLVGEEVRKIARHFEQGQVRTEDHECAGRGHVLESDLRLNSSGVRQTPEAPPI